uniref:Transposase Tc1-like domain-containing protein n=1 Tax=Sinocyclocheilus grahami TaxID=75366 RepID=A0A672S910_SINGR
DTKQLFRFSSLEVRKHSKFRFRRSGSVSRTHGGGRQWVTTPNQDRCLTLHAHRNCFMPAVSLQNDLQDATGVRVSTQTVRRRLHEVGLRTRRPAVRVPLSRAHKLARLQWATEHHRWIMNQWGTVLFTDESRFCVNFLDRRRRVWHRPGERNLPQNVKHVRIGGSSVMVWGGISMCGRTELVIIENGSLTGQRYRDEILRSVVRLYAGAMWPDCVLMDDNAGPHRARRVTEYLVEEGISRLEWPARSPDLNPIEHIWEQLQSRVQWTALLEEWQAIPQQNIQNLISSMH